MGDVAEGSTVQEYLALEAGSEAKHEYLNGVVVPMAGASPRHNLVANNLGGALRAALAAGPCLVFNSDQRVHIAETGSYVYPDVTVVCAEPRFTDEQPPSVTNPGLVAEVLSPTTIDYDRGAKLAHYRKLPSVREVILVEVGVRHVEHYRRLDTGQWLLTDVTAGTLALPSLGVELPLDEIYAKVDAIPSDSAR